MRINSFLTVALYPTRGLEIKHFKVDVRLVVPLYPVPLLFIFIPL